jgi:hypothetical protein
MSPMEGLAGFGTSSHSGLDSVAQRVAKSRMRRARRLTSGRYGTSKGPFATPYSTFWKSGALLQPPLDVPSLGCVSFHLTTILRSIAVMSGICPPTVPLAGRRPASGTH